MDCWRDWVAVRIPRRGSRKASVSWVTLGEDCFDVMSYDLTRLEF